MGLFSKDIKTFDDLFAHGLKDIYYAEHQILRALPKLIKSATNPRLKRGLKDHLKETQGQVDRLEQIFQMREEKPKGTKCYGINGLISEGNELSGNIGNKAVLDAGIIAAAQAVEHYEITRYGALIGWAREMGRGDFADILDENLKEEKAADAKLTQIGEGRTNSKASPGAPVRKVFARKKAPAARRRPLRGKGASRRLA